MPAKTEKQRKFMSAVAHNPAFAKKVNVSQSVGAEFSNARGGDVKESKEMVGKEIAFFKKKGAPKSIIKHEMAEAGMKPSRVKKYARGGGVEAKGKTRGKFV